MEEENLNNHDEHLLTESFKSKVVSSVSSGKTITLLTYVMSDIGEAKLKFIIKQVLEKYDKSDLQDLLYTCAKELIMNSIKAAIKRLEFNTSGKNPHDENEYLEFMTTFKDNLTDKKFPYFKDKMKANNFFIKIKFFYDEQKIILRIINNFPLFQQEEDRIKEKFIKAKKYENLFEFYMEHSDNTEGAGMGITLIEILLAQSGFDRHQFTIYSSKQKKETVAKVEIPVQPDYIPPRHGFNSGDE